MARIAHFRRILKDDFFKKIKFCAEFLSERDILDAAAGENYRWRNRIWTPVQTLWAFLVPIESNREPLNKGPKNMLC